jgi:Fe2+ or Zn2+ uptake regulation protein
MQYRASKSRVTKQQEEYNLLTNQILEYINSFDEEKDAETLWLGLREKGNKISNTTFNNRLRKLVGDGLIIKIAIGYNKNFYRAVQ